MAAFMGAFAGILIAPITTLYYDSGFIISLKGFVGAIIGGLASFPVVTLVLSLLVLLKHFLCFGPAIIKKLLSLPSLFHFCFGNL